MTQATRWLVLLTACSLAGACSDSASSSPKGASQQSARMAETKPEIAKAQQKLEAAPLPQAEAKVLTGTSPALPTSIVDTPALDKSSEAQRSLGDEKPKPKDPKPDGVEGSGEDRPLDPADVKVDRFVLATDVKQREPVGESDVFSSDTPKIFAFVQLANEQGAPYAFRVHWEKLDEAASPYGVKLDVPTAAHWRTWSWTAIKRSPGRYKAVLRTLDGQEIASREFAIEEPAEDCVED
jgi:hypothetical protein